jgi:WD40 repeat protein
MSIKAITVIEEFLRSPAEQHRKNAVTALAALGEKESIARLTDIALTEQDAVSRNRAEQEILSLKGEQLDYAIWLLEVATGNPAQRRIANGILGRLNDQGQVINPPRKSLLTRLRLAFSLHHYLYPSRTMRFRFRSWKSGLLSGLICIVLQFTIFKLAGYWRSINSIEIISLAVLMLILSFIIAILVTQRASPISFHRDRPVAVVVEPVVASFYSFFIAIILALFLWGISIEDLGSFSQMLLTICLITGLAGLVRAGAIFGYGVFSGPRLNKAAQVTTGLMFIILSITLVLFIGWLQTWGDNSGNNPWLIMSWMLDYKSIRGMSWVILTPPAITMAFAFARLDNEHGPVRRMASRRRKRLFSYLVVITGALLVFAVVTLRQELRAMLPVEGYSSISSITFSPDSKKLSSIGYPTHIWDTTSRQEIHVALSLYEAISVTFSQDGKLLSISRYNDVQIADTGTWQIIKNIEGSGYIATFSLDGKQLATRSGSVVRIFNTNTWMESLRFDAKEEIEELKFFPDSRRLAITSSSGIQIWDLNTKQLIGRITRYSYQPAAISTDGNLFATVHDNFALIGNTNHPDNPTARIEFAVPPLAITFSPDSKLLAVGEGSSIKLVDVGTQKLSSTLRGGFAHITGLAFSPDNKIIAATYSNRTIKLWDEWKWRKSP